MEKENKLNIDDLRNRVYIKDSLYDKENNKLVVLFEYISQIHKGKDNFFTKVLELDLNNDVIKENSKKYEFIYYILSKYLFLIEKEISLTKDEYDVEFIKYKKYYTNLFEDVGLCCKRNSYEELEGTLYGNKYKGESILINDEDYEKLNNHLKYRDGYNSEVKNIVKELIITLEEFNFENFDKVFEEYDNFIEFYKKINRYGFISESTLKVKG